MIFYKCVAIKLPLSAYFGRDFTFFFKCDTNGPASPYVYFPHQRSGLSFNCFSVPLSSANGLTAVLCLDGTVKNVPSDSVKPVSLLAVESIQTWLKGGCSYNLNDLRVNLIDVYKLVYGPDFEGEALYLRRTLGVAVLSVLSEPSFNGSCVQPFGQMYDPFYTMAKIHSRFHGIISYKPSTDGVGITVFNFGRTPIGLLKYNLADKTQAVIFVDGSTDGDFYHFLDKGCSYRLFYTRPDVPLPKNPSDVSPSHFLEIPPLEPTSNNVNLPKDLLQLKHKSFVSQYGTNEKMLEKAAMLSAGIWTAAEVHSGRQEEDIPARYIVVKKTCARCSIL